jgi:hypothetical protein
VVFGLFLFLGGMGGVDFMNFALALYLSTTSSGHMSMTISARGPLRKNTKPNLDISVHNFGCNILMVNTRPYTLLQPSRATCSLTIKNTYVA